MAIRDQAGVLDSKRSLQVVLVMMVVMTLVVGFYVNNVAMVKINTPVAGVSNSVVRPVNNDDNDNSDLGVTISPAPPTHPKRDLSMRSSDLEEVMKHSWAKTAWKAVQMAREFPEAVDIIPNFVVPLFHDGSELDGLLESVDCPVRLFSFGWNSDSSDVARRMDVLKKFPFGIAVTHTPENVGFSGAVNRAIYAAENNTRTLNLPQINDWYFIVNADAQFPRGSLSKFAKQVNDVKSTHGLVYGPRQDHFAFAITRVAVDKVGYLDEVFFPGYMEDIDYHWRVRISGLPQLITRVDFTHRNGGSGNLKKGLGEYMNMLHRSSRGWEYGWMKWGRYGHHHIEHDSPPSGWKTPFNIPGAPLSLWAIDPGQRNCVRTGGGEYHIGSSTCWYNGTVLLAHLPPGTKLSENLIRPGPSGG